MNSIVPDADSRIDVIPEAAVPVSLSSAPALRDIFAPPIAATLLPEILSFSAPLAHIFT